MHKFLDKCLSLQTKVSCIALCKARLANNYCLQGYSKPYDVGWTQDVDKSVKKKDIASMAARFSFGIFWHQY